MYRDTYRIAVKMYRYTASSKLSFELGDTPYIRTCSRTPPGPDPHVVSLKWDVLIPLYHSPLFSPKYSVCWAVLDHCSDELSLSGTRQVSVTVPPTDTISSEVTGCKGSSSRQPKRDGKGEGERTRERRSVQVVFAVCGVQRKREREGRAR